MIILCLTRESNGNYIREVPEMASNIRNDRTLRITFIAIMAAIIFVSNYFRIPFMDTKLTVANALCAIAGLLFGGVPGFLAAGLGSALYDLTAGYGVECLITLVSKGAIALIAGLIAAKVKDIKKLEAKDVTRVVIACAAGALTYVALYMLKTYLFGMFVNGLTLDGTLTKMGLKLPGSLINAAFASIAGPILYLALKPALQHAGLLQKM